MPPKAAASKPKAGSADHASYQGELALTHHNVAPRSRMCFLGRGDAVQLMASSNFQFDG
jgi:hypothetical protein